MRSLHFPAVCTLVLCALLHSAAFAQAVLGIHWGGCPFPANDPVNRNYDGTSHQTITLTAKGLSGTIRGVDVAIRLKAVERGVADAWRFDPGGCNEGHLFYDQGPFDASCPFLGGTHMQVFTKASYFAGIDPLGVFYAAEGLADVRAFDGIVADPDVTYTIARFDVDLGTACGCIDRPMCISIVRNSFLDGDGNEIYFTIGREYLNWNDPNNSTACPGYADCFPPGCEPTYPDTTCSGNPTPAHARSWGSLKASYR